MQMFNKTVTIEREMSCEQTRFFCLEIIFIVKSIRSFFFLSPKCRKDYKADSIPNHYLCFCGNKLNPEFHPWLIPHSCGDTCNKPLEPKCGHDCLLLCHPGKFSDCVLIFSYPVERYSLLYS